jgi:hypothetical protein
MATVHLRISSKVPPPNTNRCGPAHHEARLGTAVISSIHISRTLRNKVSGRVNSNITGSLPELLRESLLPDDVLLQGPPGSSVSRAAAAPSLLLLWTHKGSPSSLFYSSSLVSPNLGFFPLLRSLLLLLLGTMAVIV